MLEQEIQRQRVTDGFDVCLQYPLDRVRLAPRFVFLCHEQRLLLLQTSQYKRIGVCGMIFRLVLLVADGAWSDRRFMLSQGDFRPYVRPGVGTWTTPSTDIRCAIAGRHRWKWCVGCRNTQRTCLNTTVRIDKLPVPDSVALGRAARRAGNSLGSAMLPGNLRLSDGNGRSCWDMARSFWPQRHEQGLCVEESRRRPERAVMVLLLLRPCMFVLLFLLGLLRAHCARYGGSRGRRWVCVSSSCRFDTAAMPFLPASPHGRKWLVRHCTRPRHRL